MYYIKYIILLLLIIIIINIIYYLYNSNSKNCEKFTDIQNISGGKIDSRPCSIYFTNNISECDNNAEYYKKGITQLDVLINKYKNSKNKIDINFVKSLNEIKNNKLNNMNNCKLDVTGWKEINNYYDFNDKPLTDNIMPFKNTINKNNINNIDGFNVSGFCFKEYKEDDQSLNILYDNINFFKNDYYPITNITDMNDIQDTPKKYVGLDIKLSPNLKFNILNANLCNTNIILKNKNFSDYVKNGDKFIRIKSYIDNNNLKSKYIEIIKFNKLINNFDIITDNNILQTCIDNLFRYFYNTINKTIEHGAIKIYTQYILIEYNTCNKINKIDKGDCIFSFGNFNIPNITIGNYNNLLDETKITKLDNERENYYNDITANLSISRNNANTIIINTEQRIATAEEDLKKLKNNNKITIDFLNNKKDDLKIEHNSLNNGNSKCDAIPNTFFNSKRRDDEKINKIPDCVKAYESAIKKITIINNEYQSYNYIDSDRKKKSRDRYAIIKKSLETIKLVYDFRYRVLNNLNTSDEKFKNIYEEIYMSCLYALYILYYKCRINNYNILLTDDIKKYCIIIQNYYKSIYNNIIKGADVFIEKDKKGGKGMILNTNNILLHKSSEDLLNMISKFYEEFGKSLIIDIRTYKYDTNFKSTLIEYKQNLLKDIKNGTTISYRIFQDDVIYVLFICVSHICVIYSNFDNAKLIITKTYKNNNLNNNFIEFIQQMGLKFLIFAILKILISSDISVKLEGCEFIIDVVDSLNSNKINDDNFELFTNYNDNNVTIEKFALYDNGYYIINDNDYNDQNPEKKTCTDKNILIENKIVELNKQINQYNLQIAENVSYQNSTQNGINILKNTLKYQKKIYEDIEKLLNSFNRKYTLKDINDRINNKNILNIENYINNISNDDCIYIKII